jgi:hypothetical protein
MRPADLLADLAAFGFTVRADGDDLVVAGPPVPKATLAVIRAHKAALLAHLATGGAASGRPWGTDPQDPEPMPGAPLGTLGAWLARRVERVRRLGLAAWPTAPPRNSW